MVGAAERGAAPVARARARPARSVRGGARLPRRPRVYFEEWDEPMISGIRWVSELVEHRGRRGRLSPSSRARRRRRDASSPTAAVLATRARHHHRSWCGKKFRPERVRARAGWAAHAGGAGRRAARDQVGRDPAAGPGGAHRRRAPPARIISWAESSVHGRAAGRDLDAAALEGALQSLEELALHVPLLDRPARPSSGSAARPPNCPALDAEDLRPRRRSSAATSASARSALPTSRITASA